MTDALVILVSFVSDISYIKLDSQEISAMVILLLWRIVRLINGRWTQFDVRAPHVFTVYVERRLASKQISA